MNERIAEKLKLSLAQGRAMHGYLITGADGAYRSRLIKECAAILLFGNERTDRLELSPDFFPLDGSAKVEQIREVRRELAKQTYTGGNRVVVIENAHLLNDRANNAMLKMLEEPPEGTYFLLAGLENRVLPTIRSRCMVIRLGESSRSDVVNELIALGANRDEAYLLSDQSFGSGAIAQTLYAEASIKKLRSDAISAFLRALGGEASFSVTKALGDSTDTALTSCYFMLTVCHDLLSLKSDIQSYKRLCNADRADELISIEGGLTYDRIAFIISAISAAIRRLSPVARASQILDRLIVDIALDR